MHISTKQDPACQQLSELAQAIMQFRRFLLDVELRIMLFSLGMSTARPGKLVEGPLKQEIDSFTESSNQLTPAAKTLGRALGQEAYLSAEAQMETPDN